MAFKDQRRIVYSNTTPVAPSTVFYGPWIDALKFTKASMSYTSDSATGTAYIEQANENSPGHIVLQTAVAASAFHSYIVELSGRYVRFALVAGAGTATRMNAVLTLIP